MTFKAYTNPLYDVIEDESDWLNGLCAIFAHAVQERYGLPMAALLVQSKLDPESPSLVHAFGLLGDDLIVDARGVRSKSLLLGEDYADYSAEDWQQYHGAQPDEEVELVIKPVTLGHLWAMSPEDLDATNAAHALMDAHPERFAAVTSHASVELAVA